MKYLLTCLILFLTVEASGQSTVEQLPSSASTSTWWDTKKVKPRVALGYQKSFFTEVGVAKHWSGGDMVIPRSTALYSSLEWAPSSTGSVYGIKVGAETISGMGISGLEVKYQSNFKVDDIVITPKLGLSLLGSVSIFYGYNISINKSPFDHVGRHQFSLALLYDKSDWKDIF
ncbi:hypothetical protein [Rufibacter ruber]|uniref:hypothetical protein n=1 Tax=Rufibacter ruber TaxID=1783499 RepID=UPI0008353592|nr:hypothetical protein [Rufibacter ruber]